MTLRELALELERIVHQATKDILLNESIDLNIESKGFQDIVTAKDKLVEEFLIQEITKLCPNDRFIAEEGHRNPLTDQRTWIIDPIDGTLNFTQKNPYFGIQLALFENQIGLLSVMYIPVIDEFYYAIRGEGAYLNHTRIHLDTTRSIEDAIVTFGDFSKSNPDSRDFQIHMMANLHSSALKIRIQGSSCIDFAFVAGGKNHAHILFSKRIWEIKPGLMLLEECGAVTGVVSGEPYGFPGDAVIVSASQRIYDAIFKAMEPTATPLTV